MTTLPPDNIPPRAPLHQPQKKSPKGCLMAGGIGCLVVLLIAIGVAIYVARNFRSIGADVASKTLKIALEDTPLSEEDKARLTAMIDRVATEYKAGRITDEQLGELMETLGENEKLFIVGGCQMFVNEYVEPSDLSAEQKEQAKRDVDRFARGVYEGTISQEAAQQVYQLLEKPDGQGGTTIKESLTREELEAILTAARQAADDAEVPDEPFDVDVISELEDAVNTVIGPPAQSTTP